MSTIADIAGALGKNVTIKGSDTMVHLVTDWVEAYSAEHSEALLSVTGGGSGTGIAALINKSTDICMSSRDLSEKERAAAGEHGVKFQQTAVANDGLAVVVNPANPLGELAQQQIGDIFTGKIKNWKELGGPDQPILLFSRESSSGTYVFFQEHVLAKKDFATSARLMPATSGIIQAVAADKGAIGYAGLGYAAEAKDKVKILSVRSGADAKPVTPSEETVRDKSYPIARPLFLIVREGAPKTATAFVEFCVSPEGQRIVRAAGYVPLK